MNSKLDSQKIIKTIGLLKKRIDDRFPGSSLGKVCSDLNNIATNSNDTIEEIQKNRDGYRFLVIVFVTTLLVFSAFGFSKLRTSGEDLTIPQMIGVLDAALNVVILIGGAILFIVSIENRTKRKKVVKAVNQLRCLAHVIDSHQLTKDPCYIDHGVIKTPNSPSRNMTSFELNRYLDYCTEMLSLVSKIAFLYVQGYHDPTATKAVKDLEDLTTGLSRKIWQKIMNIKQNPEKSSQGQ